MKYERGDSIWIKKSNSFLEAKIVKVVQPYHGKFYYSPDEIRYFVDYIGNPMGMSYGHNLKYRKDKVDFFSENDIFKWEREFKINKILDERN
jgi:hypothetical protein